jgi:hypothetical protein
MTMQEELAILTRDLRDKGFEQIALAVDMCVMCRSRPELASLYLTLCEWGQHKLTAEQESAFEADAIKLSP